MKLDILVEVYTLQLLSQLWCEARPLITGMRGGWTSRPPAQPRNDPSASSGR